MPEGTNHNDGTECDLLSEHERAHHPKRRESDRISSSATRIILALIALLGASSGGYLVRDRVASATTGTVAIDHDARADLKLLRAEIGGDVKLIRQQLEQIIEDQKEERQERSRLMRRLGYQHGQEP